LPLGGTKDEHFSFFQRSRQLGLSKWIGNEVLDVNLTSCVYRLMALNFLCRIDYHFSQITPPAQNYENLYHWMRRGATILLIQITIKITELWLRIQSVSRRLNPRWKMGVLGFRLSWTRLRQQLQAYEAAFSLKISWMIQLGIFLCIRHWLSEREFFLLRKWSLESQNTLIDM
jgi:hypothetical protein